MFKIINTIKKISGINEIKVNVKEPKSSAKDYYGFNQRELFKIVKDESIINMLNKMAWIINIELKSKKGNILIHNICKIILKKKKDNVKNFNVVRAINIKPAFIMIFD